MVKFDDWIEYSYNVLFVCLCQVLDVETTEFSSYVLFLLLGVLQIDSKFILMFILKSIDNGIIS
ncbi:hypothetical protein Lalb_Chr13g0295761 [Lupinus albus]|uniref:Uncharacterized protein n=1 Tax=Lupinus albus TaxID=3870 RepID=A0A6A4PII4_LUPAL|nr:hypothetical protein Lalb_Chr13g0295761 [Lupinus albus]